MKDSQYIKLVTLFIMSCTLSLVGYSAQTSMPSLNGKTIQFDVANIKDSSNPNQGVSYTLHFQSNAYYYDDGKTKSKITGHYTYRILDKDKKITLLICHENYNDIPVTYSLLLNAKDSHSGLYIYKKYKEAAGTESRMNFGYYSELNP